MRGRTFVFCSLAGLSFGAACADDAGSHLSANAATTSGGDTTTSSGSSTSAGATTTSGDTVGTGSGSVTVGSGAGGASATTGAGGGATGAGGGATGAGGGAAGGAGGPGGGSGGGPIGGFSRPEGTLPNQPMPASMVNLPRADWQKGLLSPTILDHKHMDYPGVLNGYLSLIGNEEFWFYDIADPKAPKLLSDYATPNRCAKCGGKGQGEAESQNAPAFARYGDSYYQATVAGTGVTIWNVTDQAMPKFVKSIVLAGVNYGDFTEAVW